MKIPTHWYVFMGIFVVVVTGQYGLVGFIQAWLVILAWLAFHFRAELSRKETR